MRTTATQLVTFRRCPFLYRVLYEVKEPLPVLGTRRRFGNAVHAAIAAYEKGGRSLERGIEALGDRSSKLSRTDLEEAASILRWRHERAGEREGRVLLVEGSIRASIAGHRLEVRMDRLDAAGDGLHLAEYKSGRAVDLEDVRTQLKILAYAISDVFGRPPTVWEVELLSTRKLLRPTAVTDPKELRSFVAALTERLSSGSREPNPSDPRHCRRCPARSYCPRVSTNPRPFSTGIPAISSPTLF